MLAIENNKLPRLRYLMFNVVRDPSADYMKPQPIIRGLPTSRH